MGSVAMGAVALMQPSPAYAQHSSNCEPNAMDSRLVTCSGDLSDGVSDGDDFQVPPVTTLIVNDLTFDITPEDGDSGISFESSDDVTIDTDLGDMIIVTTGSSAHGIYAYSENGSIAVTSSGTIRTNGEGSHGIYAYSEASEYGGDSPVTVSNNGDITTNGSSSDAIRVRAEVNAYANNSEEFLAQSSGSSGDLPLIAIDNDANTAMAQVTSVGDIVTNGEEGSDGFDVRATGSNSEGWHHEGNYGPTNAVASVSSTGDITINGSGGNAFDVDAEATGYGEAHAMVTSVGDVTTMGDAFDVSAHSDSGDATATVSSTGDVSAGSNSEESARAFDVYAGTGDFGDAYAAVTSVGDVTSTGDAFEVDARAGFGGNATAMVDSTGDVTTTNSEEGAAGFDVQANAGFAGSATASITSSGDVTTSGESADAFSAHSYAGYGRFIMEQLAAPASGTTFVEDTDHSMDSGNGVSAVTEVVSTGDITTDGPGAQAFDVSANASGGSGWTHSSGHGGSMEASASVTSTGDISTNGESADAFRVSANAGSRYYDYANGQAIAVSGSPLSVEDTGGDEGDGDSLDVAITAAASVTSTGAITTNGESAGAFSVYADAGSRFYSNYYYDSPAQGITVSGSSESVEVDDSPEVTITASASVTSTGDITTNGESADAFRVRATAGNRYYYNYDYLGEAITVSGSPEANHSSYDPQITITATAAVTSEGNVTTYGDDADGFNVSASAGNDGWMKSVSCISGCSDHGGPVANATATVMSTGDVTVNGSEASAFDVHADSSGYGDATAMVTSNGTISSTGDAFDVGAYTHFGDASATVSSTGDVTAGSNSEESARAFDVYAGTRGDGDAYAGVVSNGNISSTGDAFDLDARAGFGGNATAMVDSMGDISTNNSEETARAFEVSAYAGDGGSATASVTSSGDITTNGESGDAFSVHSYAGYGRFRVIPVANQSAGGVTSVEDPGDDMGSSNGVSAISTVVSTGDVTTDGSSAQAFDVTASAGGGRGWFHGGGYGGSMEATASVTSTGEVTTNGEYSDAFRVRANAGSNILIGEGAQALTDGGSPQFVEDGGDNGDSDIVTIIATAEVTSNGNVTTDGPGSDGFDVSASASGGGGKIPQLCEGDCTEHSGPEIHAIATVNSTGNVTINSEEYGSAFRVSAFAGGGGDATASVTSSGDVVTNGEYSDAFRVSANSSGFYMGPPIQARPSGDIALAAEEGPEGMVTAEVTSEGDVSTNGNGSDAFDVSATASNGGIWFNEGVYSSGYMNVTSTVSSTGDVSTSGDNASAFEVDAVVYGNGTATASVSSNGNISTQGNFSYGIDASAGVTGYGSMIVDVDSTGDISTQGVYAHGIIATAFGNGEGNIDVTSTGDISTSGNYAQGIIALAETGDVTVTSTGDITTTGAYASGIVAGSFGSTVNVTSNGDITTTGPGILAFALEFQDGDANASIYSTGNVTTSGFLGAGITSAAATFGEGNATATSYSVGDVSTSGPLSLGVSAGALALDGDAVATVSSSGNVTTTGPYSPGVNAAALAFGDYGNASASVYSNGDISTSTFLSPGILAISGALGDGDATTSVVSSGDISTMGGYSFGILAAAYSDGDGTSSVSVSSTGNISTTGEGATGIYALAVGSTITVTSEGDISTAGDDADGIGAFAYGNNEATVHVTSNGNISTTDDSADGFNLYAEVDGDGNASITLASTGNVSTTGSSSEAIDADAEVDGDGNTTISITSMGDISTSGESAEGFDVNADVYGNGDATVTIMSTGSVTTSGNYSEGFDVDADVDGDGTGMAAVTSAGNVMTSGQSAEAFDVESDVFGNGTATASVTSTGDVSTSGNYAEAFDVDTDVFGNGDASVTVVSTGDVSTSGNYAEAFDIDADVDENGDASVIVSSMGNVMTAGESAEAFDVEAEVDGNGNATATVTSAGDVSTSGNYAEAFDILADVDGDGNSYAALTSHGNISTLGDDAEGIDVESYVDGNGNADISVTSTGNISTAGEESDGVEFNAYVYGNGNATAMLTSVGDVMTSGYTAEAIDIEAYVDGNGDSTISVMSTGSVSTLGTYAEAFDIDANVNGNGNAMVSIVSAGDVSTAGNYAEGFNIEADVDGNGNASVSLTSTGNVSTLGDYAEAIEIDADADSNGNASVTLTSTGNISTIGEDSEGVDIESYVYGDGNATITATLTGNVSTTGDESDGLELDAAVYGNGNASIMLTSMGDISTSGMSANGIEAQSVVFGDGDASISIDSSGDISTSGNYSNGIIATSYALGSGVADVSINSTGNITTTGAYSSGIGAGALGSDVSVTSSGDISTAGHYAYGIGAFGFGYNGSTSSVTVHSTGSITTTGEGSVGIFAYSNNGTTSVTSNGHIATHGNYAEGILAVANGMTTVSSTGDVSTTGSYASAITVLNFGPGMTTVSSSGNVSSDSNYGIFILGGQDGDAVSLTTAGSVMGGTDGIYIDAGTGDLTVGINSDVTGADHGIVTITQNGTDITIAEGQTVTGSMFGLATMSQSGSSTANDHVVVNGQINGLVGTFEGDDVLTVNSTGVISSMAMLGEGDDTVHLNTNSVGGLWGGDGFDTLNFGASGGGVINNSGGSSDSISEFEEYNFLTGGYVLMGLNQGLTNTNFLAGQTILAGMLESINSTIGVNATLLTNTGSSIIGNLTNNGTLDVNGGFIGTLDIDGDYEQGGSSSESTSGSGSLELDFLTGLNDLITVSGDVSLGGTLNFNSFMGALPGTSQTIIDGGTGLNGVFSDVNGLLSGLLVTQSLVYDTTNFDVNIVASAVSAATIPDLTINQINAGDNLIGLLSDSGLDSNLQALGQAVGAIQENDPLQIALEELHPEYLDVGLKFLTTSQNRFMQMLVARPEVSFGEEPVKLASLDGVPATVAKTKSGASVWGALQYFRVEQDGGREFIDFDGDAFELAAGINGIEVGNVSFGIAGGYSDFDADTQGSSSSPVQDDIDSEIYHIGVNMQADLGEIGDSGTSTMFNAGLAYASGENEFTVNGTDPVTGLSTQQRADVDTSSVDGLARLTFENERWPITPHIQAGVTYYEQDPTTIVSGANSLAVEELENTRTSVGIGATYEYEFDNGVDVKASLTGVQYFGDTDNVFTSRFVSASSSSASFQTFGKEVEQQVQFDASIGHTYNSGARISAGVFGEAGDLDVYGAQIRFDMPFGKTQRTSRAQPTPVAADPPPPVICDDGTRVLRIEDCPMPVETAMPEPAPSWEEYEVTVYFDHDRSELAPQEIAKIDAAVASAAGRNISIVLLEGHADRSGGLGYNDDLSRRRALTVRDALVSRGISVSKVTYEYFGETQPAVPTDDGVRLRDNRRTEIVIRVE